MRNVGARVFTSQKCLKSKIAAMTLTFDPVILKSIGLSPFPKSNGFAKFGKILLRNEGARVFTSLKCMKNNMAAMTLTFNPVISKSIGFFLSSVVMFVPGLVKLCSEK